MKYRVWSWFGPFEEYGHFISNENKKIIEFDNREKAIKAGINYKNNFRILTIEDDSEFIEEIPSLEEQILTQKAIMNFDGMDKEAQDAFLNQIFKTRRK